MFRSSYFKLLKNQLSVSFSTAKEPPVIFQYKNNGVKVLLNKPKSLNALDWDMIEVLQPEIEKWNKEGKVKVAIFEGVGGKAFCAGGDIKSLYEAKYDASKAFLHDKFFRHEYILDHSLASMKPIQVAFWDGIVMGGGVGISIHAPIKIATENSMFAMPEAKIGLFTDVAGGYFLSRLRNNLGVFLGLTGQRLKGAELVQTGLANFYVKKEKLSALEEELLSKTNEKTSVDDLREIVKKYAEKIEPKYENEAFINEHFGKGSLTDIYNALKNTSENKEFASKLLKAIDASSPISLHLIFEQIRRGKNLNLQENFGMDLRLVHRCMEASDFFEGVRCTLVDKNDKPKWQHKSIFDVSKNEVEKYFEKLPENEELKL